MAYVDVKGDLSSLNRTLAGFFGGSKLGALGKKAGLGIGLGLGAGIAAAGIGKGLFDLGSKFDSEFDKIRVASGKTGKTLDGLEDNFRNVVGSLPTDFDTAGSAVAGLNQRLGLTGKPLERLSKQIIQLSRITGTDVSENVESLTRLFGDWSISTEHQAGSLDKLFRIQQKTGLGVSKNARLLVQFGAPLRQLGFDFDEASAMFGKFEKEGVNLQTILPGFRFGLKNLSAPTKEAGELFEKLGISIKKGPAVALQEVFDAIKKAPSDLKANEIAFAVFGKRAGPDMAAAVREGRFEYENLIREIDNGTDTIDKAERNTRDFAETWQRLKNQIFVGLEPLATKVFDTIGDGLENFAKLSPALQGITVGVPGVLLALGPIAALFSTMGRNAKLAGSAFGLAGSGAAAAAPQIATAGRATAATTGAMSGMLASLRAAPGLWAALGAAVVIAGVKIKNSKTFEGMVGGIVDQKTAQISKQGIAAMRGGLDELAAASQRAQVALPAIAAAEKNLSTLRKQGKTDTHAYAEAIRTLDAAQGERISALRQRTDAEKQVLHGVREQLRASAGKLALDKKLGASDDVLKADAIALAHAYSRQQAALLNVSRAMRGLTPITGATGTKMGALLKTLKGVAGLPQFKKFLVTTDISSANAAVRVVERLQKLGRVKTALKIIAESKSPEAALKSLREKLGELTRKRHDIRVKLKDEATVALHRLGIKLGEFGRKNPIEFLAKIKQATPFADDVFPPPNKKKPRARGGVVGLNELSLVGEEGPELAKYAGKTGLVGLAGPEIRSFPENTRIYSHPETKRKLAPVVQKVSRVLDGKSLPGVEGVKQSGRGSGRTSLLTGLEGLSESMDRLSPWRIGGYAQRRDATSRGQSQTVTRDARWGSTASITRAVRTALGRTIERKRKPDTSWSELARASGGANIDLLWNASSVAPFVGKKPSTTATDRRATTVPKTLSYGFPVILPDSDKASSSLAQAAGLDSRFTPPSFIERLGTVKGAVTSKAAQALGIPGFARGGKVKAASEKPSKSKALAFAHDIWPLVASRLRAEGMPMPKVEFAGSDRAKSHQPGPGTISITQGKSGLDKIVGGPWWMKALSRRAYEGLYILTHEFGHIFQLDPRNLDQQEGGAEGFAGRVAPGVANTLGVPIKPMLSPYRQQIRRLKKQRGKNYEQYVLNRQFGFDSKGRKTKAGRAADEGLAGQLWYEAGGPKDHKNLGRTAGGLQPAARYLANTMRQKFGLNVSPQGGVRPGDSGSFHSVGKAVDLVGSKMREGAEWVKTSGLYKTLLEGIHNPNLSTDSGKLVSSGFWGGQTWAGHKDHVHLAADSIRQNVKQNLDQKGGAKKRSTRITGGSLSLGQMVTLSKKAGFPDPALAAAIGYAESRGKVGAVGDGGDSLGLFQINTPAHPKYDKDKLQGDALYNARAALSISRKGKSWQPWTQYRTGAYKQFLGAKGAPLPKGTTKGTATGSSKSEYLAMRLLDAESDTPADPKDDIRWINRALRYWRGVRKRNLAVGNWARATTAKGEINTLREKKSTLREELEDPNLFKLDELTQIGSGVNAFKIGGLQTTLDNIDLEKANAGLTVPADNDDSIGALKASLQDDIAAANRRVGFWQGLKTLTDGFLQPKVGPSGAFNPSKEQSAQLNRTKSQPERIGLLNKMIAGSKGTWIEGTIRQKIEAAEGLGGAKDELRSLLAEINKTDEVEAGTSVDAKAEIKAFMAAIGDLTKTFGSNFRPLQSFGDGGIIQGPKGRKVVIEGHGGEAVINEDGNLVVTIDPKQLERMIQQPSVVNNVDARHTFANVPKNPHRWSEAIKEELTA